MRIGRNDPCPCGSNKKYKNCCLLKTAKSPLAKPMFVPVDPKSLPEEVLEQWEKSKKAEKKRRRLGLARPIIHTNFKGKKLVAVGNQFHWSEKWQTFIDFLMDYIISALGKTWGSQELKKPLEERHQIMKLHYERCQFQRRQKADKDGMYDAIPNGSFLAYILLAYDLYLLRHHSAIQKNVVDRLKTVDQFQGARYELFVAATCIKAGFDLEYEDEKDRRQSHVEFIATHKTTGQKVCVEAKSRHREGVLGQPGSIKDEDDVKVRIGGLLNAALRKQHSYPLVVFIDVNIPPSKAKAVFKKPISNEFKKIIEYIDKTYGDTDKFNLLVISNFPHHYGTLDEPAPATNVNAILSQKPEIAPEHPEVLIDIYNAATTYGNVPVDFPEE